MTATREPGTIGRMPNQPKTPQRTVRVDDELWAAAKATAAARDEAVSEVIVRALEDYVAEGRKVMPPPSRSSGG